MNYILFLLLIIHAIWIVGFQTFGILLLPVDKLYLYPVLCSLVSLHWIFFDNKCILSILEDNVSDKKNVNKDTQVYNYIEKYACIPILHQKKIQHTMMTISFITVAYLYRKEYNIVLMCLLCLYLNRWELWSKHFV